MLNYIVYLFKEWGTDWAVCLEWKGRGECVCLMCAESLAGFVWLV